MACWTRETGCPIHAFSLVVCRYQGKWLAVEEVQNRGWWLPGGFCEPGDDHFVTAWKETKEEAGLDVELKGILRIENHMTKHGGRQRVIFYAEPKDENPVPKQVPDEESVSAAWLSLQELEEKAKKPKPEGLRGRELLQWAQYIEAGGTIYPLQVLAKETDPLPSV